MAGVWKNVGVALTHAVDEAADLGFRAGTRGVKMAGGLARAATAVEHFTGTNGAKQIATAAGKVAGTKMPRAMLGLYATAAVAGVAVGAGKQAIGTVRDAASMTGVSGSFLAQHSIRRVYGYRDSRPNYRPDETLGDLTLNLGNISVMNRSIRR